MNSTDKHVPLAERMRPRSFVEFVGQTHLLAPGKPFHALIEQKKLISMILWGPPGSGKTTLARLLCENVHADFVHLSAESAGVKDVRAILERVRERTLSSQTVLFLDEIHRFSKSQQDSLLHAVESGDLILIGATTENPSFEVIPPLRSRARTYVLQPLTMDELRTILHGAISSDPLLSSLRITIEDEDMLIAYSGGDARALLNGLELCCIIGEKDGSVDITSSVLEEAFQRSYSRYDKSGEEHYNTISAFIKSVRGSDPDAAVYWLARMLNDGEDPLFIARRLIILASEDIGNADPNALLLATAGFQSVHSIGMPEARIVLSQVTTYLASTHKSNASYRAIEAAMQDATTLPPYSVPLHLRNAPTGLMKSLGYGKDYLYPHSNPSHFIVQQYLPDELANKQYYQPTDQGRETRLKEFLARLWTKRKY